MGCRTLFLALLLTLGGLGHAQPAKPNVVLLSVDTLRADRLGCYGHDKPTSPNIDALAAQGLLFEDALCEVPLTAPSMSSMLSGRYPRALGLTRNGVQLPESIPLVTERFRDAGYATFCVQSNWTLKADLSSINRGFDTYEDDFHKGRWGGVLSERPADEVAEVALKLLAERPADKPFFAWIHFTDPHGPYTFRDNYNPWGKRPWRLDSAEKVRVQYDSEVRYTDHHIGLVLEAMPPDTIVVFVADHGESLYEHGYLGHGRRVYQPGAHIPLVVRAPGLAPGRSKVPVRGADIGPTLLGLAGLPALELADGVDILAAPPAMDRVRVVEAYGGKAVGLPGMREAMAAMAPEAQGLVLNGWKLVADEQKLELYDLAADPKEQRNAYAAERARAEDMKAKLDEWNAARPQEAAPARELSGDDVEALRALGYIE